MPRRRKAPKEKARKKVTVKLLSREHAGQVTGPYKIMDELIAAHHSHLATAKMAIAWRFGWKADADGRMKLGQAKKGSDLDRELHGFDFVVLLNHEQFNAGYFTEAQQRALIDHELCHCEVSKDSNGEEKTDENGRTVYRIRKHDVEEFREVVSRHGLWKTDLEQFVAAAAPDRDRPLLKDEAPTPAGETKPAKHETNGHIAGAAVADWRDVSVADLKLNFSTQQTLTDAGIENMGQVADYSRANGGMQGLEGLTGKRAAHLVDRLQAYWDGHPEQAQAYQQSLAS